MARTLASSRITVMIAASVVVASLGTSSALAQLVGPSTSQKPYVIPAAPGVVTRSIISNGDGSATYNGAPVMDETYAGGYRLAGIPDGMGAYDNNDGTFTLLVNHELQPTTGNVRAHGTTGAFVSKWVINKNASNLAVLSGADLITSAPVAGGAGPFNRFCSADLPAVSAFYNPASGLGTQERIYMKGEEAGAEGRGFGTILSTGAAHYLPQLGKFSWENALASPFAQNKTIVMGMDDSTPGQVYMYVGSKTNSANPIDAAGLNNGKLYGLKAPVYGETTASTAAGTATFVDLSAHQAGTGANLDAQSNATQVTNFARPEDGVWNPAKPNEYYWVNTGSAAAPTRLYRMTFDDITNPELGGKLELLLEGNATDTGTKPHAMDNMTLVNGRDGKTRILVQEDGGAGPDDIWMYTVEDGSTLKVATHDAGYSFANSSESSGIIPAWDLLGDGWFLFDTQAAYSISSNGLVAGGQVMAIYIPQSVPEPTTLAALGGAALLTLGRRRK